MLITPLFSFEPALFKGFLKSTLIYKSEENTN
jgi:hypothetical protein